MGTPINPFVVLGVDGDATRAEIEAAYRRRVETLHPDRFEGSSPKVLATVEERLGEAALAYHLLTDDEARLDHLHAASAVGSGRAAPPWVAQRDGVARQRLVPIVDPGHLDLHGLRARRVVALRTWQTPSFLLLVLVAIVVMIVVQQTFAG